VSDFTIEWDNVYGPPSQRSDHLAIDRTTLNLASTQYLNGIPFATAGGKCSREEKKL
jgi:hypothetical protein